MSSTLASPTTASRPTVTGPDPAGLGAVAAERRVLADDGAVADAQQVAAGRHLAGEHRDALPDAGPERPQVQHVERRPDEQHERVDPHQPRHVPEAQVGQAPQRDLPAGPPTDQQPLGQDRHEAGEYEQADGQHRGPRQPPVDRRHLGDPGEAIHDDERPEVHRSQEDQQLGHTEQDVARSTRTGHRLCRCGVDMLGPLRRGAKRGRERRDRRVQVDVLHRRWRQVRLLADAGREPGHEQRVGAQVVEEMAVDRHPFDAEGARERLGEDLLGGGGR
jgi:hypothetical protein